MSLLLTLGLGGSGATPTPPSGGNTPYMNLLLPIVSVTLGPLYATEVNNAFLRVDSHDHSDGYGKLVGTNGLNINADLSFHGFRALNQLSTQYNIQSPTAGLVGQVYMLGQDLYCTDGAGNVIQITAAGAVNVSGLGSWTGLTAPAAAQYNSVTKKFSLKSNTTGPVFGLLEVGDIFLFPGDPNLGTLPYIRLATPAAGVSSYTWQFPPAVPSTPGTGQLLALNHDGTVTLGPPLPSVTSFLRISSTGVTAADVTIDTGTMQLAGAGPYVLGVKPQGIATAQIANQAVTPAQQANAKTGTSSWSTGGSTLTFSGGVTFTPSTSASFPTTNARPILVAVGPAVGGAASVSGTDLITFTILFDSAHPAAGSGAFFADCTVAPIQGCSSSYIIPPGAISASVHSWQLKIQSAGANFAGAGALYVTEL